jgi:[protein-PII] uridylyltransferase
MRSRLVGRSVSRGPVIQLDAEPAQRVRDRRDAAVALLAGGSRSARRAQAAPAGYALSQGAADVARHCQLLEPCPDPDTVRLAVTPTPAGWHVDVAARDRRGLLASTTGVLASHSLNVTQAVIATWDDGAALQAFVVDADPMPDPTRLQEDLAASLGGGLASPPVADASVDFDDDASPWYTRCDVRVADRRGLFHALAVAIADSGADVHAARASTVGDEAFDRFDLTDRFGRKLTPSIEDRIRTRIRLGLAPSRLRP